jgi:cytochrome c oxidase cbb3-type subunit 3
MSAGWNWYVIIFTVANILACFWLIRYTSSFKAEQKEKGETTGHVWDGDLEEYSNPLPRWWLWLFYITIVFALVYMAFYPGLGNYKGIFGWSQQGQYEDEMAAADQQFAPIFASYAKKSIPELAKDVQAMESGQRLFLNYCSTCHGSAAQGAKGFPNLADKSWIWGDSPEAIKTSILDGRNGVMPNMGINSEDAEKLTAYVLSLSGRGSDNSLVEAGKALYTEKGCIGCHGPDGKGNMAAGFPNLTDDGWIYGNSPGVIKETIMNGRNGVMPAHRDFLGEEKSHLLAAYVYSLSN